MTASSEYKNSSGGFAAAAGRSRSRSESSRHPRPSSLAVLVFSWGRGEDGQLGTGDTRCVRSRFFFFLVSYLLVDGSAIGRGGAGRSIDTLLESRSLIRPGIGTDSSSY